MSKIIEVLCGPAGEISVQAEGFSGGACRDAASRLLAALGQVTSEEPTMESFQTEDQPDQVYLNQ